MTTPQGQEGLRLEEIKRQWSEMKDFPKDKWAMVNVVKFLLVALAAEREKTKRLVEALEEIGGHRPEFCTQLAEVAKQAISAYRSSEGNKP